MRNTDERLEAVLRRTEELARRDRRRRRWIAAASAAACLALIAGLALAMPAWTAGMTAAPGDGGAMTASLFSGGGPLGYLVIGILSFLLGATVTILCFRLGKRGRESEPAS